MNINDVKFNTAYATSGLPSATTIAALTSPQALLAEVTPLAIHMTNIYGDSNIGSFINKQPDVALGYVLDYLAQSQLSSRQNNGAVGAVLSIVPVGAFDVVLDGTYRGYIVGWRHSPYFNTLGDRELLDTIIQISTTNGQVNLAFDTHEVLAHTTVARNFLQAKLNNKVLVYDRELCYAWIDASLVPAVGDVINDIKITYQWRLSNFSRDVATYNFDPDDQNAYTSLPATDDFGMTLRPELGYITVSDLGASFAMSMQALSEGLEGSLLSAGSGEQAGRSVYNYMACKTMLTNRNLSQAWANKVILAQDVYDITKGPTFPDVTTQSGQPKELFYLHTYFFRDNALQLTPNMLYSPIAMMTVAQLASTMQYADETFYGQPQKYAPDNLTGNQNNLWIRGNVPKHVVLSSIANSGGIYYAHDPYPSVYVDVAAYCDYLNQIQWNSLDGSDPSVGLSANTPGKFRRSLWPRQKAAVKVNSYSTAIPIIKQLVGHFPASSDKKTRLWNGNDLTAISIVFAKAFDKELLTGTPDTSQGSKWRTLFFDTSVDASNYIKDLSVQLDVVADPYGKYAGRTPLDIIATKEKEPLSGASWVDSTEVAEGDADLTIAEKTIGVSSQDRYATDVIDDIYGSPVQNYFYLRTPSGTLKIESYSMTSLCLQATANFLRFLADLADAGVYLEIQLINIEHNDDNLIASVNVGNHSYDFRLVDPSIANVSVVDSVEAAVVEALQQ